MYFFDTDHEVDNRRGSKDKLQKSMIERLIHVLHKNPYSRFFRGLAQIPDLANCNIRLKANPKIPDQTQNPPIASQVAAIWNPDEPDGELAERDIRVHTHDGHSRKIQYYYGCYDPLQYPLLFPLGEPGWHQGIKKTKPIHTRQPSQGQTLVLPGNATTAENLIAQEAAVYQNIEDQDTMVSAREFYAYRLQIRPNTNSILLSCGRLLQQFVVDMYVKIETSRLDYFRNKQEDIRFDLYKGIIDSVNQGESQGSRVGTRTVLPRSFIGGPRDMQKRYLDAMALVQKFGKPDIFLTMTCNPAWPEIKNELRPHEEAQNRQNLLVRVFKSKLEQMRKEVIKEELFGPVATYTYAVEFQKRGLPHVHLLIILKRPYKLNTADKFDAIISAEIPHREHQPHLYATVLKHMMHGPCGDLDKNRACMKDGQCKYRYPRDYCADTTVSEDGYPIYRRRQNPLGLTKGELNLSVRVSDELSLLPGLPSCVCEVVKLDRYMKLYRYWKVERQLQREKVENMALTRMVVHGPFLRWDIIRNPPNSSARKTLNYLEIARDVLFAILEVEPSRPANHSNVTDILLVDQRCVVNANKLKQLPPLAAMYALLAKSALAPSTDSVSIINLPSTVEKVQLINVKEIARLTNFDQPFHYLDCSCCNRASNAYENAELWCSYCARRVPALASKDAGKWELHLFGVRCILYVSRGRIVWKSWIHLHLSLFWVASSYGLLLLLLSSFIRPSISNLLPPSLCKSAELKDFQLTIAPWLFDFCLLSQSFLYVARLRVGLISWNPAGPGSRSNLFYSPFSTVDSIHLHTCTYLYDDISKLGRCECVVCWSESCEYFVLVKYPQVEGDRERGKSVKKDYETQNACHFVLEKLEEEEERKLEQSLDDYVELLLDIGHK
ncbi:hypothetical protein RHGRI_013442 [Rhododendron griersonianum]|uniref:Helitron helicase-like domain-containing protein n=1 Tax=Rhododendron griersonianum TaxID=479676 RepID=A0AAV6K622_9ERIC|nr:hypothetical protein RHGRI_013442 [Rhododendron griersonianum]